MASKGWIITHFVWFVLVYECKWVTSCGYSANVSSFITSAASFSSERSETSRDFSNMLYIRHFAIITLLRLQRAREAVASHVVRCRESLKRNTQKRTWRCTCIRRGPSLPQCLYTMLLMRFNYVPLINTLFVDWIIIQASFLIIFEFIWFFGCIKKGMFTLNVKGWIQTWWVG